MSANPRSENCFSTASGVAECLYFTSGEHTLFGWLHHPPTDKSANFGMVICKPFGYEAICAHRSIRAFADASSALGVPTLRFDYLGCGDSADIDPQADQLESWSQDIVAAVAELQRRTGVERVCLLGIRLGALLATLAAGTCQAVNSLVLIAPIVSGRRYLRELRTTRLAASLSAGPAETAGENSGTMEISGFSLSAATLSSIAKVDLIARGLPAVSEILVIDGNNMPSARAWTDQPSRPGLQVTHQSLPGMVEMIMTAPQFASIPNEMISAVREYLLRVSSASKKGRERAATSNAPYPYPQAVSTMKLPDGGPSEQSPITERPVIFGSEAMLFGMVTEPRGGELRRRAVILLNAGADYHIGASGMYVGLARAWARSGYVVLRMDFAGIGDSGTRPARPDNEIFPQAAIDDIAAAIAFIRGRYGALDVTVAGLCSGAYHALRAAAAALPVERVMMINPQNYFWKEGQSIYDMQIAELVIQPDVYRGRMLSIQSWRRLFAGKVDVRYVTKLYAHRVWLVVESTLRDWARNLRIPLPRDLGAELEKIAARGVQMVFVFSRGEPGIELLAIQGGSAVKRLGSRCRVHIIEGADHVFSKLGPRKALEGILSRELFAPIERSLPSSPR